MKQKTVFMFSGQGSQYFQMGRALYDEGGTFAHWMRKMDAVVRELSGQSVVAEIYGSRSKTEIFDTTSISHPAIYMVEVALAQTLIEAGLKPDVVLGASLGSFAAATIAGCMKMEDALTLIVKQAAIFEAQCAPGGMIAVLGNPHILSQHDALEGASVASYNFDSHFVLSAQQDRLAPIEAWLRANGTVFQRLPVSFAYHSPWIEPAKTSFLAASRECASYPAMMELWCCAVSAPLQALSGEYFWNVVREPIFFQRTVAQLESKGSYRYLDLGPSGTLATFLKYLLQSGSTSTAQGVMSPYDRDVKNVMQLIADK